MAVAVTPMSSARGMALLSTMILLLAVTTALATIFYRHQLTTGLAARALHSDQATLLALSAESWTSDLLSGREDDRAVDSLEENWAQPLPALPLEGGELRGCLLDLQSKVNINNFASLNAVDGAPLAVAWQQLLADSGEQLAEPVEPRRQLAALIDWLDDNDQPLADGGREYYPYNSGQPERFPPNRPISDVAELAVIEGFSVPLAAAAERFTTALPRSTAVNLNTAERPLLRALAAANSAASGFAGEQFADWVVSTRPFNSLADFQRELAAASGDSAAELASRWPATLVAVNSDYFELIAEITLGDAALEYRALLDRRDRERPVVIARTLNAVAAVAAPRDEQQRLRQQRELASPCQTSQERVL